VKDLLVPRLASGDLVWILPSNGLEESGGVEPLPMTALWGSNPVAGPTPQHSPCRLLSTSYTTPQPMSSIPRGCCNISPTLIKGHVHTFHISHQLVEMGATKVVSILGSPLALGPLRCVRCAGHLVLVLLFWCRSLSTVVPTLISLSSTFPVHLRHVDECTPLGYCGPRMIRWDDALQHHLLLRTVPPPVLR
jgi:hypothetical protein